MQLALIAVAGAAGALLRYGVGRAVQPETFPAATLTVNVTGSFAIGFLATFLAERTGMPAELRLETLRLAQDGEWTYATLNVVLSVTGALAAVWVGQTLARQ